MKLPFWLKDKDWKELQPRDSDGLADDDHLTPRERAIIGTIKKLDRRTEWNAVTFVERNNLALLVLGLMALIIASLVAVCGVSNTWNALMKLIDKIRG